MTWHGRLWLAVGDVPDNEGRGGSRGVTDAETVETGDVATVRDGDVAWLVGVGVGDEHALA